MSQLQSLDDPEVNVYVLDEVGKQWTRYCDVGVPQLQEQQQILHSSKPLIPARQVVLDDVKCPTGPTPASKNSISG